MSEMEKVVRKGGEASVEERRVPRFIQRSRELASLRDNPSQSWAAASKTNSMLTCSISRHSGGGNKPHAFGDYYVVV
jgi:hypothetical protein